MSGSNSNNDDKSNNADLQNEEEPVPAIASVHQLAKRSALTTQDPEMQKRARERALIKGRRQRPSTKKAGKKRKNNAATAANVTAATTKRRKKNGKFTDGNNDNTIFANATSSSSSSSSSPKDETNKLQYYAVRSGYITDSALRIKPFRSAIFLHLEDAQFFATTTNNYKAFVSIKEAKDYLKEGEAMMEKYLKKDREEERVLRTRTLLLPSTTLGMLAEISEKKISSITTTSSSTNEIANDSPTHNTRKTLEEKDSVMPDRNHSQDNGESATTKTAAVAPSAGEKQEKPMNEWDAEDKEKDKMIGKLIEYKLANNGSVDIPENEKGSIALRRWLNKQCKEYHHLANMTPERVEQLKEIGVDMPPSWDDMHDRLAAHQAETGTLDVNKYSDGELYEWTKPQKLALVKHFSGNPTILSIERVIKLKALGYTPSRPNITRPVGIIDGIAAEVKWNAMLEELTAYKLRNNGRMSISDSAVEEKHLKRWISEQRREFKLLKLGKPSNLTARRIQRLTGIGFDPNPTFEYVPWEVRIACLKRFVEEHGHCRVPSNHPELGVFVSDMRKTSKKRERGEKTTLTDERVNELEKLGFVFQAGKTPIRKSTRIKSWDERFEELLEFKEDHGHTVVPQLSGSLGEWVRGQRVEYKKYKAGKTSRMTAEKALRLTEIGFCFDASRSGKRSKSSEEYS